MSGKPPTRGLADTKILIHHSNLDAADLPDELFISAITLAELSAGPYYADDPVERSLRVNLLQHVESTFEPLPFDTEAARAFGLLSASVLAAGRKPRRRADLMIASTALVNQLPLYTTNPDDFAGLDSLLDVVAVRRPETPA
ncbi:type II toxin-antitoxin system VapC family toxin [Phytohabitans sp. ZYX-F-186]|uniref:Type II toxin-antitoxin system VapC family toxin n=1 Tax=Phytohabitans maris TaxID=3071409 RepID=A0ABU0ZG20_9ACTN|nr:type II toxin-antitoxin system VapC family toxin [Phytohabitans sp. ZYX-F-186]MDQ7906012.1 type II toxin-antitoxin system VapC family toxin [Phytohabitans sp. ZYX-F-186]